MASWSASSEVCGVADTRSRRRGQGFSGRPGPDPEQAQTRAAPGAATVLGRALTRYALRFPASVALGRDEIVDWVGPTIQRYLTAPAP